MKWSREENNLRRKNRTQVHCQSPILCVIIKTLQALNTIRLLLDTKTHKLATRKYALFYCSQKKRSLFSKYFL